MPRTMWKGAISFGLVSIPIRLYPSTEEKSLKFNQLHDEDHGRIKYQRVCAIDGEEVPFEHIVKGYEYEKDKYVVLTDEDFDAVPIESSRSIDILQFVDLEEIDPIYYKKTYYLIPEEIGRQGVHAPARGDGGGRPGRDRQGLVPRQGAPGDAAVQRRRVPARDDVLARRDPRGRLRRDRRVGQDQGAAAGGPDGARA